LRQFVHLEQRGAFARVFVGELRALGHGNAIALRQALQRLVKADALQLHDEFQYVAVRVATEAVVELLGCVNRE
jgi:hypothetical protein